MPLLLLLLLITDAQAKRVAILPPEAKSQNLPRADQRFLAQRVGEALRTCGPLRDGALVSVRVDDQTSRHFDTWIFSEQLEKELKGASSMPVELFATITLREWKSGKNLAAYTLKVRALSGGKKICEKLHRTVLRRAK